MHRALFLFLLTVVSTAARAQGGEPDLASRVDLTGFPVYTDPAGRFTVTYPAEWAESDPNGGACFFAGFLRQYEDVSPDVALLTVSCDRYRGPAGPDGSDVAHALGIDTEEGFDAFVGSVAGQSGDDVEALTHGPAVLGGRPAFRWTYRQRVAVEGGAVALRALQYVVVEGGTQYGVSCSTSEELWDQAEPLCEALARTFTVGPGAAGARP